MFCIPVQFIGGNPAAISAMMIESATLPLSSRYTIDDGIGVHRTIPI